MEFYNKMHDKPKVLITGCSSGLGVFLAEKFEKEGHKVLRHNGKLHFDLSNQNEVLSLAEEAKKFGVSILINNAAIVCPDFEFENYSFDLIDKMIDVNLRAPIILTLSLLPELKNIININSIVGLEIKKNRTLYSATKWGMRGFFNSFKTNSSAKVLDVYPSNIQTTPDRLNALDINFVVDSIYNAYVVEQTELILDGRNL
jgi:short-subunit dehydrogenase